jgi:hypothetical protein
MAAYPSTNPFPTWPYTITPRYKTLITEFDNGAEQRRAKWTFPKFDVQLGYTGLQTTAADIIYDFYRARRGAYEEFTFHEVYPNTSYTGLLIAYHTLPAQTTFSLPGREASGVKVYINDVETTAFTIQPTSGTDGRDLITLGATVSTGSVLTCDFVGRVSINCRFNDDNLDRINFDLRLFNYGITLKGL